MALHAQGFTGHCDACGAELQVPALDATSAKKFLRLHGWECAGLDLCRHCKDGRDAGVAGVKLLIDRAWDRLIAHG